MEDITILCTAIIAILISGGVGVFGMMWVYQAYPDITGFEEPTCDCPDLKKEYDRPRQSATALGFFFGMPVVIAWWIWTRLSVGTVKEKEMNEL